MDHKKSNEKPYISTEEAAIESLSEKVKKLENELDKQRNESKTIIIGVLLAALLVFMTIGVEVMIFHTRSNKEFSEIQNNYFQKIEELKDKNHQTELELEDKINKLESNILKNSKK